MSLSVGIALLQFGISVSSSKEGQKKQENAHDIHVQDQGPKYVLLRAQLVLLPSHHQLSVIGQKLQREIWGQGVSVLE